MDKNGKDTKHTRHISIGVHLVRNGESFKMHKFDWCEGGMQSGDIVTNNFGEDYLNTRMKYIMVILYNWDRTLVHDGWWDTGQSMEQELHTNRLDLVEDSAKSDWNVCK